VELGQFEKNTFFSPEPLTLPAITSRVRNVLWSSKKVSMTPIDHINQQAVATYEEKILSHIGRGY
jgi:hypothetical protein